MYHQINGLHHITTIASSAQKNYEFYSKLLGLRLVKKTVNPDYPRAYHLYYGNKTGDPGTILSVLPWENIGPGFTGTGTATDISFSIPPGSLQFWQNRIGADAKEEFEEVFLQYNDPDGLNFKLVVSGNNNIKGWHTNDVSEEMAILGLHGITMMVKDAEHTAGMLTDIFGYYPAHRQGNKTRFITDAVTNAHVVDLVESPGSPAGYVAGGSVHYVAFRVSNEAAMDFFREKILLKGWTINHRIDNDYFSSFYFREPGGILIELATDKPGFTIDEPVDGLGSQLKLPARLELERYKLENLLPHLITDYR